MLKNIERKLDRNSSKKYKILDFSRKMCLALYTCNPMLYTHHYHRSNYLSLEYQKFTPSGCKNLGIGKFELVAKTQFLYSHTKYSTNSRTSPHPELCL